MEGRACPASSRCSGKVRHTHGRFSGTQSLADIQPMAASLRYSSVYVFRHYNMRTEQFKELRQDLQETSK